MHVQLSGFFMFLMTVKSILQNAEVCGKPGGQKTKTVLLESGIYSKIFKHQRDQVR